MKRIELCATLVPILLLTSNLVQADDGAWGCTYVSEYDDLSVALDEIEKSKTKTVLHIDAPTRIVDSEDIPETIRVRFYRAGIIDLEGNSLIVNGGFDVLEPPFQIFTGSGDVTFGNGTIEAAFPQWWGATGNGSDDDTEAIQAAMDAYETVHFPRPKVSYSVSSLFVRENQTLKGPGKWLKCLVGNGVDVVLQNHDSGERIEGVSVVEMGIENPGKTVVRLDGVNDFLIRECAISQPYESNCNDDTVKISHSRRGTIIHSKVGSTCAGYAISAVGDVDALTITDNWIPTNTLGNGVEIGSAEAFSITGNIFEHKPNTATAHGIRVGGYGSGSADGFSIGSNYFENVSAAISIGEVYECSGGSVDNNFINNATNNAREYGVRLGRAFGISVTGNRYTGQHTDAFLQLYEKQNAGDPRFPINCEVDRNLVSEAVKYEFVNLAFDHHKGHILAKNKIQFAEARSQESIASTFVKKSETLTVVFGPFVCNTGSGYLQVIPAGTDGGMVERVEIIDIKGNLSGHLYIGTKEDIDETVHQNMSEISSTEGYGGDVLVSTGGHRAGYALRLRHIPGCTNGSYKTRITYRR